MSLLGLPSPIGRGATPPGPSLGPPRGSIGWRALRDRRLAYPRSVVLPYDRAPIRKPDKRGLKSLRLHARWKPDFVAPDYVRSLRDSIRRVEKPVSCGDCEIEEPSRDAPPPPQLRGRHSPPHGLPPLNLPAAWARQHRHDLTWFDDRDGDPGLARLVPLPERRVPAGGGPADRRRDALPPAAEGHDAA